MIKTALFGHPDFAPGALASHISCDVPASPGTSISAAFFMPGECGISRRSQFWGRFSDDVLDLLAQAASQRIETYGGGFFERPHALRALDHIYLARGEVDRQEEEGMTAAASQVMGRIGATLMAIADAIPLPKLPGLNGTLHIEARSVETWMKENRPKIHKRHFGDPEVNDPGI